MILIIMYDVFYENKHFLWSLIKSISTKQKYIINAHTPKLLLKKNLPLKYKKNYVLVNIRMINLSLDELRLAQSRNIREYENKSKEDLTKALSKSEPKPKPETKPKQTLKPETKPKTKPKQTPK